MCSTGRARCSPRLTEATGCYRPGRLDHERPVPKWTYLSGDDQALRRRVGHGCDRGSVRWAGNYRVGRQDGLPPRVVSDTLAAVSCPSHGSIIAGSQSIAPTAITT